MEGIAELENARTLDEAEAAMSRMPQADCPVTHHFTPGLYIRSIRIPAGTLVTSMEHKTEHPFVITAGRVRVASENEGSVIYEAPHMGITRPGTKRLLHALEDTVWTTFHVTDETDIERIAAEILEPNDNPLITDHDAPEVNRWRGPSSESIETS